MNTQERKSAIDPPASPFCLENESDYQDWRQRKLIDYPTNGGDLLVPVADPMSLTAAEKKRLLAVIRKTNMVVYHCLLPDVADKDIPRALGRQLGLHRLDSNMLADDDGITSLEVVAGKSGRGYIPYSNRRLLWHTDGYYNQPEQQIRAFILHCVRPAPEGGENALCDPEMVYMAMRDRNPDYIAALMHPQAMTIPANEEAAGHMRPAQTGPVFSIDDAGNLHMRYTARTRSIEWRQDPTTLAAVSWLGDFLNSAQAGLFRHRLAAGQGNLSNNVLHNRTAVVDAPAPGDRRLLYRARYYDRIADTDVVQAHRQDGKSC